MNYSVKVVINGIDKATAPIRKVMRALEGMGKIQSFRNMTAALGNVRTAMGNVGKESGLLGARLGGLAAVGGIAFKALFLDTAVQFEKFMAILTQLEGSSAKAKKDMAWISNFSSTTPYELTETTDAFVRLRAYGMKPMGGLLRGLGDASAAMGKPLMASIEMIADAVTGENERLKEFGIKARTVGKKILYEYTQNGKTMTKSAMKSSREQIQATILGIFNSKYSGAMDKLSKTFGGMLSNLSDQWTRLSMTVMSEGLFDFLKGELSGLMDAINKLMVDPKFLAELKVFAKDLQTLFVELKMAIVQVWPEIVKFGGAIKSTAQALGGYGNLLKVITALMAAPLVVSILSAIGAFASAMGTIYALVTSAEFLWAALGVGIALFEFLTAPITLTVAAIIALAGAAILVYQNWNSISGWFAQMWQKWGGLIRAIFPYIGWVVDAAQVIMSHWGEISGFFQNMWATISNCVSDFATNAINFLKPLGDWLNNLINMALKLAEKLPNKNVFTGQDQSAPAAGGSPASGGKKTAFVPGGSPLLNPGSPVVASAAQKDQLNIAMKIDSEGRPSITKVATGGNRNLNFMADMGMVYS